LLSKIYIEFVQLMIFIGNLGPVIQEIFVYILNMDLEHCPYGVSLQMS